MTLAEGLAGRVGSRGAVAPLVMAATAGGLALAGFLAALKANQPATAATPRAATTTTLPRPLGFAAGGSTINAEVPGVVMRRPELGMAPLVTRFELIGGG